MALKMRSGYNKINVDDNDTIDDDDDIRDETNDDDDDTRDDTYDDDDDDDNADDTNDDDDNDDDDDDDDDETNDDDDDTNDNDKLQWSNYFRKFFNLVVETYLTKKNRSRTSTCDGIILKMHYKWSFYMFFSIFVVVIYQWYNKTQIECVYEADTKEIVEDKILNICLSYIFVMEDGEKRFLLYYRWIPWSMLLLSGLYYIPWKVSTSLDNSRCKQLLEALVNIFTNNNPENTSTYDHDTKDKKSLEISIKYMHDHLRTHNGLYWKYLGVNVISLVVDIIAYFYLDLLLQGQFRWYLIYAYPFERYPQNFTDPISMVFTPFASCEIDKTKRLLGSDTTMFGCHLTMMEVYEKVFLAIWLWLFVLSVMTLFYILFLIAMWCPFVQTCLLRSSKSINDNDSVRDITTNLQKICKIGDIYLLYRMKSHLSNARFYKLMINLSKLNKKPASHMV